MGADSPLPPADAARLVEFARACKAAARAVALYPEAHPAIGSTLGRLASLTSPEQLSQPLRISVLADDLLLDGHPAARPDPAVAELAALLHSHRVGELIVGAGGDPAAWRAFFLLLSRSPESLRADGGIAQLWIDPAGRHLEVREIDYAHVLRERRGGLPAAWDQIVASCLQGEACDVSDEALRGLLDAPDASALADLLTSVEARAGEDDPPAAKADALIGLLRGILSAAARKGADVADTMTRSMSSAVGQLSPDMLAALLARARSTPGAGPDAAGETAVVQDIVDQMSDDTIAGFVAQHALEGDSALARVAQAFQTLVPDSVRGERLLTLAHDVALDSPAGRSPGFEESWNEVVEKVLASYSDKPFVSEEYARELNTARMPAIDLEQLHDDPPERVNAWLDTVATSELRQLDLTLMLDLLRIEQDSGRWAGLMRPAVSLLEDLLLVGDIDAAEGLLHPLVEEMHGSGPQERRNAARGAIDALATGPALRHITAHLSTVDAPGFERLKTICVSLGEKLARPLADAITSEEHAAGRDRLAAILTGFGASGRREAERLKSSPNAAVRRIAIHLLRDLGGSEALNELTGMLHDREPQVQREAVRALLNIGNDKAYKVLERALVAAESDARDVILQALSVRDERTVPLFAYILDHVDHRGSLSSVYMRAIDALGTLKSPAGIPPLKGALYRGEWWAPRRSASFRSAAAGALARIGTPDALAVLEEARRSGPRGVRAAADSAIRAHPSRRHV